MLVVSVSTTAQVEPTSGRVYRLPVAKGLRCKPLATGKRRRLLNVGSGRKGTTPAMSRRLHRLLSTEEPSTATTNVTDVAAVADVGTGAGDARGTRRSWYTLSLRVLGCHLTQYTRVANALCVG
jgi:hypothetical protein